MKTRVSTVICPNCKDEIYSRAQHDFNTCSCGQTSVDGGFSYLKICYKDVRPQTKIRYVNATRQQLYDDWNLDTNYFGVIKNKNLK